jgi:outer membrane protein assembly factor BamB
MKRLSILAVAAAAVALLAVVRATSPAAGVPAGWQRIDLHPVTQPAAISGRVVVLAARAGRLWLLGLDARTGKTRWSQPASTGENAPGQPPLFAVAGNRILYLRAAHGLLSELAAADAQTGRTLWHTPPARYTSFPDFCPVSRTAVCVTRAFGSGQPGSVLRFEPRSGCLCGRLVVSRNPYARAIGSGLYDPGERTPELLVASDATRVLWVRRLRAIFPQRGVSTDWGWSFGRLDEIGLFIGTPGTAPKRRNGLYISNLADTMTAGFRIADGRVAWRTRGAYQCEYVPCAGESQLAYGSVLYDQTPDVGVRLLATGTISGRVNSLPHVSADARATLQGFEPSTGKTLWTFAAGHDPGLISGIATPPRIGPETIALRSLSGALVALNLRTGASRRVNPATPAWCSHIIEYRLAAGYRSGTAGITHQYIGQNAIEPCTAAGRRGAPATPVSRFVGASIDRLVVWSDRRGVFASPGR